MPGGENFLSQLKAVVDPLTIFSHYLSLKKSGNRYRALCPFHSEKTPSFYAAENGMFHCFGCAVGGDVIKFVMLMEKLDFKECIQLLSSRYGIPLKFSSGPERREKDQLLDLMRQAADFYHNLLTTHQSGKEALDYLEQRGVTKDTIRRFQIGWAPPSWNSLLEHFEKKDVTPALLEKCGLVVARQQEGYYDRYRSRVIVPIHDIHGNIIALGGRIFQGTGEEAKYLNSPESPLYSKSHHLFGLYFSKEEIQTKNRALLVEGYFDMIVPFQEGHTNIVASLGTSLTENQAHLLRRYTENVVLFYDPDFAGRAAVLRALPILLQENFVVYVAQLPSGLDPDKYVREKGPEGFEKEIEAALRYDQLFFQHLSQSYDLKSASGRLSASDELIGLLNAINNPFERDQLINRAATRVLNVPPQVLQDLYNRKQKRQSPVRQSVVEQKIEEVERHLLQALLLDPHIAVEILPEFEAADFEELSRADLFRQLQQIVTVEAELATAELIHQFPVEIQGLLTALVMDKDAPTPTTDYARDCLHKLKQKSLNRITRQIDSQIESISQDDEKLRERLRLERELRSRKN